MKLRSLKVFSNNLINQVRSAGKTKIFCIGLNKTGTTSVKKAWEELGVVVGNQGTARGLLHPWIMRDFRPIIKYSRSAQAFQDSPFSFPYTYIGLDQAFPESKFILTIRNDPEQWYNSIIKFHGKLWANNSIPTKNDLQNAVNGEKGRPWIVNRALFDSPEDDPYQKEALIIFYENHIKQVKDYFKFRQKDLLVINISDKNSYKEFCEFINKLPVRETFPWENRT